MNPMLKFSFLVCGAFLPMTARPSTLLSPGEVATALFSDDGDFLFAGKNKVLIRWKGTFAGSKITTDDPSTDRIHGDLYPSKIPVKLTHLLTLSRTPAFLKAMNPEAVLASWSCHSNHASLHFAPQQDSLEPLHTVRFSISDLVPQDLQPRSSELKIIGCGLKPNGTPYILMQSEKDKVLLVEAFTELSHVIESRDASLIFLASGRGRSPFVDFLFAREDSNHNLTVATLRWNPSKPLPDLQETGISVNGHNPNFMRAVIRNEQALLLSDEQIWLLKTDSTPEPSNRLTIAPCESEQFCGLSLGADGSWAVSGYWGHYAGLGKQFRRIPLPQFSSQKGPVTLAHSGMPGEVAIFGEFDASFEKIEFSVPMPSPSGKEESNLRKSRETAVAWLRPGAIRAAEEQTVLQIQNETDLQQNVPSETDPIDVVLTSGPFDHSRHIAFESPLPFQLEDTRHETEDQTYRKEDGLWWQSALNLEELNNTLKERLEEPPSGRVAIIDTGADLLHPDFKPHARDTSATKPIVGYDFVDDDQLPQDEHGHGTHVAGLSKPPFWLFSNLELLIYRALDHQGRSNSVDLGRAILEARRAGAQVINASWGGGSPTQFMSDAIIAAQQSGVLFVTSAGNDGASIDKAPPVPSHLPGVISIGASDPKWRRAHFSNYGRENVLTLLPGVDILSLALGGGHTVKSGTSMAAPLFSGFAAVGLGILQDLGHTQPSSAQKLFVDAFCKNSRGQSRMSRCDQGLYLDTLETLLALRD